ncbi:MAG: 1-acyl-sn-glycerol-3-phosphate acyltransferase [Cyclobacteriaceae bacterium]
MIYTAFVVIVYLLTCVVMLPTLVVMSQSKKMHPVALRFHEWWAKVYFKLIFMRVEVVGQEKLQKGEQYIFCCNHFSFLDIPAFYLFYNPKFIGKSSLKKIPLFGYFFKKIHIPVDRSSSRSRAESLQKSQTALDEGYSLAFFPEGGIVVKEDELPYMRPFKQGAFKLGIENKVSIVPVTMPYNFEILPDKSPIRFYRRTLKIIIHDPIDPSSYDDDDTTELKSEVFQTIQTELLNHHPDKVKSLG